MGFTNFIMEGRSYSNEDNLSFDTILDNPFPSSSGDTIPIQSGDLIDSIPFPSINWTKEDYDMIFVLPPDHPEFYSIAQEYAEWKAYLGIRVLILDNYTEFTGVDESEQLRNALIYYYQHYSIQWLLLMGDTGLIPIRYVYNPDVAIVGDHEAVGNANLKPTDFYYADLTGDWNIDGDQYWGEDGRYNSETGTPELDYYPELYVGRFPVDDADELALLVNKTMGYEMGLNPGDWMGRYLAISGISDRVGTIGDTDGEDEAVLNQFILDSYVEGNMDWIHTLEHTSAYIPPVDPRIVGLSQTYVKSAINNGTSIVIYAGHGSPTSFSARSALTSSSISDLTNYNMSSFLYADACSTNAFDAEGTLGETFLLSNTGGGIGYVGSMRLSWYYPNDEYLERDNRALLKLFVEQMFSNKSFQQGKALYESKVAYVESEWFQLTNSSPEFEYFEMERKSIFSYMLLGDPTVDIYTNITQNFQNLQPQIQSPYVGAISEVNITDSLENPVPYARIILFHPDGGNHTFYADENGTAEIIFPQTFTNISYRLIGHNMNIMEGNISLTLDTNPPVLDSGINLSNPSISMLGNLTISANFSDDQAGIYKVYLVVSQDNFESSPWEVYQMNGDSEQSSLTLSEMMPGDYIVALVTVDRAGNSFCSYPAKEILFSVTKSTLWNVLTFSTYAGIGAGVIALGLWIAKIQKNKSSPDENDIILHI
ncbi:MAG: C25 family cysteine peptidase [Promethearchaeota archaeon]